MKTPISKETAEARVVQKYHKLYKPLVELVAALECLEPGGTLVDDVVITGGSHVRNVRIAYTAHPIMLTIQDEERAFILRIVGLDKRKE